MGQTDFLFKAMNGNLESTEIHIRGLRQMVQISGGLVTANSFHGLRRLIAWYVMILLVFKF